MLTLVLLNKFPSAFTLKKISSLICYLSLCLVLTGCDLLFFNLKSKAALQVEDHALTLGQFSTQLALRLKDLDPLTAKDPAVVKSFKSKIISDFIVDAFIKEWAQDSKLVLDPKSISDEQNYYIALFPNDKAFREQLALLNISYQDWKKRVELELTRKALFASFKKQISDPNEAELESYYLANKERYFQNETVLVQTILVTDEAQADVIKRLHKKTSLEQLHKEYSLDRKTQGSFNFGWVERTLGSELEPLFVSKTNALLGPFQFAEGFRLFKVIQRRPSQQKSFDSVKAQIKNEIYGLRETARFSAWLDEQVRSKKVFKNTAAIDALIVETTEK